MSTGRVIWLVWCLGWAAFWFFVGLVTLGLGWILAAGSLLMFLVPVGKTRPRQQVQGQYQQQLPPYEPQQSRRRG